MMFFFIQICHVNVENQLGLPFDRINWSTYDLVVIDESHNFRNGGSVSGEDNEKENRYLKLLNKVIRPGVKTKVLMLSATPVNNRFYDLRNQLALAYEGQSELINDFGDIDLDDQNLDIFNVGKKFKIDLRDMDYLSWQRNLTADLEVLELLLLMVEDITPEYDYKLNELLNIIEKKIMNPINQDNKKIIIFTAFSDTAEYLYENVSAFTKAKFGLNSALITGDIDGRTTIPKFSIDMNTILTCFSPVSKEKSMFMPNDHHNIDILIATDCISEGQNLQDCDWVINYDIHWNPVRIIQRFGRIDRIGSKNQVIQLVNFWPDLNAECRIKNVELYRMKNG